MKKSYAILTAALVFGAAAQQGLFAEEESIIYNGFKDVGYQKETNWECAQGLGTDGEYFYFAGHNDKTNEGADIHVIRISDNKEIRVLKKKGPLHSAEVLWYEPNDTLIACSGGNNRKPFVWEINKETGELVNSWDFMGHGERGGALIARMNDRNFGLFSSSKDGAKIAFTKVELKENGVYIDKGTWFYSERDLGVPQGLEYRDGYFYYLADADPSDNVSLNPHVIYKIKLLDDMKKTVQIVAEYRVDLNVETEGLAIGPDGSVYFGTAAEKINKLDVKYNELKDYRPAK